MRPARRLLALLVAWTVLAVAASFWPVVLSAWVGAGLGLLAFVLFDTVVLYRRAVPRAERFMPRALSVGEWHDVSLRLRHEGRLPLTVEVFDGVPATCEHRGLPRRVRMPARGWARLTYRLRPMRRGEASFSPLHVLSLGPLGLMQRLVEVNVASTVRVYPNFRQVSKLAMLAVDNRTASMGIHLRRRRGEGTEFFQLREYREGDLLRQVDWKAVSRRQQLISRDYREEQNQQVIFLIDCGRRMHSRDGDIAHFDHVLNAVLLLSYVALRNGDGVGILTFSSDQPRWLKPVRGRSAINRVLNTVYDLETTTAPSDFSEAAARLVALQKRRALVVLLTNLRDDDSFDLPAAFAPLQRRHLVLVASLREPVLEQVLEDEIESLDDALRAAATLHYLEQRRRAHQLVKGRGLRVLDVEPSRLPVSLVNKYLEIKRSGAL